jgi:hypothetical protein
VLFDEHPLKTQRLKLALKNLLTRRVTKQARKAKSCDVT